MGMDQVLLFEDLPPSDRRHQGDRRNLRQYGEQKGRGAEGMSSYPHPGLPFLCVPGEYVTFAGG